MHIKQGPISFINASNKHKQKNNLKQNLKQLKTAKTNARRTMDRKNINKIFIFI